MTKEEIQKKRFKLRISIRENMNRLKEKPDKSEIEDKIKEKVIEFNNLTDQLRSLGFNPTINTEHLTLEYWGLTKNSQINKTKTAKTAKTVNKPNIIKSKINTTNNIKPIQCAINESLQKPIKYKSVYILTLAWSETKTNNPSSKPIEIIKKYFEYMKIKMTSDDFSDIGDRVEHMMNYRFYGTEEAFEILKKTARFIIDNSITSDYDKFNIDIFGKKLE